jgi:hypothetical protein
LRQIIITVSIAPSSPQELVALITVARSATLHQRKATDARSARRRGGGNEMLLLLTR